MWILNCSNGYMIYLQASRCSLSSTCEGDIHADGDGGICGVIGIPVPATKEPRHLDCMEQKDENKSNHELQHPLFTQTGRKNITILHMYIYIIYIHILFVYVYITYIYIYIFVYTVYICSTYTKGHIINHPNTFLENSCM